MGVPGLIGVGPHSKQICGHLEVHKYRWTHYENCKNLDHSTLMNSGTPGSDLGGRALVGRSSGISKCVMAAPFESLPAPRKGSSAGDQTMFKGRYKSYISAALDGREPSKRVYLPRLPPSPHDRADHMGRFCTVCRISPTRASAKHIKR